MSYESRAYDEPARDGFGPDPVVVLVVKGTHDVSRFVNLMAGRGQPVIEQLEVGRRLVGQVQRDSGGRAALRLLAEHGGPDFSPPPLNLSDRVMAIVRHMAAGKTVKQIGREMVLSKSGVSMHLNRARKRLGLDTNDQLVALCVHLGLVDPPEVAR